MATTTTLSGWTLVSLRPQNQHAGLRQAARARGARLVSASPFRLKAVADDAALARALACRLRIAVSPAAVRFAAAMAAIEGDWLAIGQATANALRRAGAASVQVAQPQTAAGLLQMPMLQHLHGQSIGLITAPDGLGMLESALPARGAELHIAHSYRRQPLAFGAAKMRRLLALQGQVACLVTSQAAFGQFWRQFAKEDQRHLRHWTFVASSPRLLHYLQTLGISRVLLAENTRSMALLTALATATERRQGA